MAQVNHERRIFLTTEYTEYTENGNDGVPGISVKQRQARRCTLTVGTLKRFPSMQGLQRS